MQYSLKSGFAFLFCISVIGGVWFTCWRVMDTVHRHERDIARINQNASVLFSQQLDWDNDQEQRIKSIEKRLPLITGCKQLFTNQNTFSSKGETPCETSSQ